MKRNVWIMNHYATNMYFNQGGRHYYFGQALLENNYSPTIFCASTNHDNYENIETDTKKYIIKKRENLPFVFIKTNGYKSNNYKRILNMISFYKNLITVVDNYANEYGKPDVIIASSVHPLTLKAGIKIARKYNVPCIVEIRDLWPESLVAYNIIDTNNPLTKLLYNQEKKIYIKSNSIIMSWEGGSQYIIDKGWDQSIDMEKVHYISNGIVLDEFDFNSENYNHIDSQLDDRNYQNIVYTGSIRKVNNIGLILDTAKIIAKKNDTIRFLIYGSGDEKEYLEKRCENEKITNVHFKNRVEKKYIPSITKKSYANLLHNSSTSLNKYGQSQNKLYEYLASGKPVIQTYKTGYSVIDKYNCGVSADRQTPENIARVIIELCNNKKAVLRKGENARKASKEFDFKILSNKMINIIEQL